MNALNDNKITITEFRKKLQDLCISVWQIFSVKLIEGKYFWLCRPYDPCDNSASAARKKPEITLTNEHDYGPIKLYL